MRVLVTGATGFLGGAVARRLHAGGHDVLATGRDIGRGGHLAAEGLRFLPVDLVIDGAVTDLCRKQDWVIHCAARSSPWGPFESFYHANVRATRNLVAAATREGVSRFVHVSTPSIYMGAGSRRDVREDEPQTAGRAVRSVISGSGLRTPGSRPRGCAYCSCRACSL